MYVEGELGDYGLIREVVKGMEEQWRSVATRHGKRVANHRTRVVFVTPVVYSAAWIGHALAPMASGNRTSTKSPKRERHARVGRGLVAAVRGVEQHQRRGKEGR